MDTHKTPTAPLPEQGCREKQQRVLGYRGQVAMVPRGKREDAPERREAEPLQI